MDEKKSVPPAILGVAVILLLGIVVLIAFRTLGAAGSDSAAAASGTSGTSGSKGGTAAGGTEARTVAPVVQKYPDGSVVPYTAAPTGARPGDPSSIHR